MYDGLGNETVALILNISAILKQVSSTFKKNKCPIIPELFSILFTTDYSQNYSGIIDTCLPPTAASVLDDFYPAPLVNDEPVVAPEVIVPVEKHS